jgi:hypothetical protein
VSWSRSCRCLRADQHVTAYWRRVRPPKRQRHPTTYELIYPIRLPTNTGVSELRPLSTADSYPADPQHAQPSFNLWPALFTTQSALALQNLQRQCFNPGFLTSD